MGTQDSNLLRHLSREMPMPSSFIPFTAFHRHPQGALRLKKPGRWGAMHVCIAWKIYDHKQRVKRMQIKSDIFHSEIAPAFSSPTSLADSMQRNPKPEFVGEQPPNGSSERNMADTSGRSIKAENTNCLDKSQSPHQLLRLPSEPNHDHQTNLIKMEDWVKILYLPRDGKEERMDEKESHGGPHLASSAEARALTEKALQQTGTPEPDEEHVGSLSQEPVSRKRRFEHESHVQVKRVKQEIEEDGHWDLYENQMPHHPLTKPSCNGTHNPPLDLCIHAVSVQQNTIRGVIPSLCPISNGYNTARQYKTTLLKLISHQEAEKYLYPGSLWGPLLDVPSNNDFPSHQNLFINSKSMNRWEATKMQDAEWWHKERESFHGLLPQPIHLPHMEVSHFREKEFPHSLYEKYYPHYGQVQHCHSATTESLHQSGFLPTDVCPPHVSRDRFVQQRLDTSARFTSP